MFPWIVCGVLFIAILLLIIKIVLLQKGMDEMCDEFRKRLSTDTNTIICVSSNDRHLRMLAEEINKQLRLLRKQRHKYLTGDAELKTAVTNISHDLRTPLTAICGYLELLEQEEKSEIVERYLSAIGNRADALKNLTEELFRYSVILSTSEDLNIKEICLNDSLEEALAGMYAVFKSCGVEPQITIPEKAVFCQANNDALGRVFNNVLSNVLKYSDGDLTVVLSEDGSIVFSNSAKTLNEIQVGKLFDRFYTVENARNSTGLGLSISRILMEQMNGTISAKYEHERLSICISLPNTLL